MVEMADEFDDDDAGGDDGDDGDNVIMLVLVTESFLFLLKNRHLLFRDHPYTAAV